MRSLSSTTTVRTRGSSACSPRIVWIVAAFAPDVGEAVGHGKSPVDRRTSE